MDERMFLRETMSLPKITRFTSVHRDSVFQDVVECAAKAPSTLLAWWEAALPGLLKVIPKSWEAHNSYLCFNCLLESPCYQVTCLALAAFKLFLLSPFFFPSNPTSKPQSHEDLCSASCVLFLPQEVSGAPYDLQDEIPATHPDFQHFTTRPM